MIDVRLPRQGGGTYGPLVRNDSETLSAGRSVLDTLPRVVYPETF